MDKRFLYTILTFFAYFDNFVSFLHVYILTSSTRIYMKNVSFFDFFLQKSSFGGGIRSYKVMELSTDRKEVSLQDFQKIFIF